jgi:hypothetical protein
MLTSFVCVADDALVTQASEQVVLEPQLVMHATAAAQALSPVHAWVSVQQLDCTQLAHAALVNVTPHAIVEPEPLLDPPLPLLEAPLLEAPLLEAPLLDAPLELPPASAAHSVAQL